VKEIFGILAAPQEVFEGIMNKPRWLIPTLFCTGTLFVIVWLGGCWQNLSDGLRIQSLLGPALISPIIVIIVSLGSTAWSLDEGRGGRGHSKRSSPSTFTAV
jgi:hypothetical protein